ncbi:MAG: hypothetical protein M1831_005254 [Alyxoria varia]|nr:MAG: hypothetical protein M1831_005254 [Alyxoria varia]
MGWFRSTQKQEDPSTTDDGSYKPLKREERQKCWEARDAYFTCLDKNNILDAIRDRDAAAQKCPKQSEAFAQDCASSWVTYFKQKRVAEFEKEQKIKKLEAEGAVPAQQASKPGWKIW